MKKYAGRSGAGTENTMIRILLIDDHTLFPQRREGASAASARL